MKKLLSLALALMAALAASTSIGPPASAEPLRLVVGYTNGSTTDFAARLLVGPLQDLLGREVVVENIPGDHGFLGVVELLEAPADGDTLLIADTLTLALNQVSEGRAIDVTTLTPVSKISLGLSVAMIARHDSPISDWDTFLTALDAGPVSASVSGRMTAYGVARSMVERETGTRLDHVEANGNNIILLDVLEGRADVGFVATNSVDLFNASTGENLHPIVTFGAQRSPRFPHTATFAEVTGNDRNDFTVAFSVFGPPDLPADRVATLDDAFAGAVENREVVLTAADFAYPVHHGSAEEVRLTLERDLRVANGVADLPDQP